MGKASKKTIGKAMIDVLKKKGYKVYFESQRAFEKESLLICTKEGIEVNSVTKCIVLKDGEVKAIGYSYGSPKDQYNRNIGRYYAVSRAALELNIHNANTKEDHEYWLQYKPENMFHDISQILPPKEYTK